jgi:hypothetical protein
MQLPDADYGSIDYIAIAAQKMPLSQAVFIAQESSSWLLHHALSDVF